MRRHCTMPRGPSSRNSFARPSRKKSSPSLQVYECTMDEQCHRQVGGSFMSVGWVDVEKAPTCRCCLRKRRHLGRARNLTARGKGGTEHFWEALFVDFKKACLEAC